MWGDNKIIWKSGTMPNSVGRGAVNSNNEIIPELEFQQKRIKDGVAKRCGEWNHVITKIPEAKKPPVFEIKKEGWLFLNGYLGDGQKRTISYYIGELFYDEANEIFTDKWATATAWTLSDSVVSRRISEDLRYVGEAFVDPNWDNTIYGGVEWSMYEPLYDGTKELVFNQEATVSKDDWREKLLFNEADYLILAPFPCGIDYLKRFDYQSLTKSSYDKTRDSAYYQQVAKDFFEPQVSNYRFYKKNDFGNIYKCKHCGKFMRGYSSTVNKVANKTVGVAFEITKTDSYDDVYISRFNNEMEPTYEEEFRGYYDSRETMFGAYYTQKYISTVDKSKTLGASEKLNSELPRLHSKQSDIYLLLSSKEFDVTQYEYNPFLNISLRDSNFNYSNYKITLDYVNPVHSNLKKRKTIKDYDFNRYFKKNKIAFASFKKLISYNEYNSKNFYNIDGSYLINEQYSTNKYIYNIFSGEEHVYKAGGNYSVSTCTIADKYEYAKRPILYFEFGHQRTRIFASEGLTTTKTETKTPYVFSSTKDLLNWHGLDILNAKLEYTLNYNFNEITSKSTPGISSYCPQKFTFSSIKLRKINENALPVKTIQRNYEVDRMDVKVASLPNSINTLIRKSEGVVIEEKVEEWNISVYQVHKDGTCVLRYERVQ